MIEPGLHDAMLNAALAPASPQLMERSGVSRGIPGLLHPVDARGINGVTHYRGDTGFEGRAVVTVAN